MSNTTVAPHAPKAAIEVGDTFRPWNTDSMGTATEVTSGSVRIRYDHDESVTYTIGRKELDLIGRFVNRDDFK